MDSNAEKIAGLKTGLVSMVCLLGATFGGYRLYLDLNELGRVGFGTPVGKVERREAKVRRKLGSSYVWTNVQANEDLYRKDSLQTGPGSAASIRLTDGSVLDVGESSLVVMDDTKNLALGFVRGSAVVHKADGDAKISIGKDGKAKVEELPARLLRPESLARYFVMGKNKKPILFTWDVKSNSQNSTYQLQVSSDKKFATESTQTFSPQDVKSPQVAVELRSGAYYWRVQTSGVAQTETRQFKILTVNPIQAVYPGQNEVVSATPEGGIQFRWVNPRAADSEESDSKLGVHEIQVSQDAEFKKVLTSEAIEATNGIATLKGLPEGALFWRIRSSYADINVASAPKMFSIKNRPQAALLPFPTSIRPENGAVLNSLNDKVPLEASWTGVEGAEAYEVNIFQALAAGGVGGAPQRKEIAHLKTEKTLLSLKNLKPGEYLWTIRSLDKEKHPGEPLPIRGFKITLGEPLAAPEVVSSEVQ